MTSTQDDPSPTPEESEFFRVLNEQLARLVHLSPAVQADSPECHALGVMQGLVRSTFYCHN